MQTATITIVVPSEPAERFLSESNDIVEKAMAKLQAGEYTCDISDTAFQPANPS